MPVAQIVSMAKTDTACIQALSRALLRQGPGACAGTLLGARVVFSIKRACPDCGRSFAELDPRSSRSTPNRLVRQLLRYLAWRVRALTRSRARGDLVERCLRARA